MTGASLRLCPSHRQSDVHHGGPALASSLAPPYDGGTKLGYNLLANDNRRRLVLSRKFLSPACLSVLGLVWLSYLAGAVVMFFQLPTSGFVARALIGASAWHEGGRAPPPPPVTGAGPVARASIDRPAETYDGFTLYACLGSKQTSTQAMLIDMRGEVVHRWAVPFSRVWPSPTHLNTRVPDLLFCFYACHLYPNGDLLVVFHGRHSPIGCGLAKLDKDSNVLWSYAGPTHHDVEVADDGTIYAIEQKSVYDLPKGLERIATPCDVDDLVVLSPEGKPLREPISVLEAFLDTPYADLLESVQLPVRRHTPPFGASIPKIEYQFMVGDPLHTNSVRVLGRDVAAQFPLFEAGQLLLSIRDLAVLAVIDPASGKVVWAARGPWYAQHDAHFLPNGHLLLFDNLGAANGSRVLEYDPQTQAFPWSYAGPPADPFYSSERGMCQRLPNGNTLIVNSEGFEIFEVTREKNVVWSTRVSDCITTARRYGSREVPFLSDRPPRP